MLLTWGLFLCAGIIDNASCEQLWPRQRKSQRITVSRLLSYVKITFQARANKQRLSANQSSKENSFRRRDMQLYWVRRSMNKTPVAVPVNNDYILDNLALAIVGKGGSKFPNPEALRAPGLLLAFGVNNIPKLRAIIKAESKDQGQPVSRYSNRSMRNLQIQCYNLPSTFSPQPRSLVLPNKLSP